MKKNEVSASDNKIMNLQVVEVENNTTTKSVKSKPTSENSTNMVDEADANPTKKRIFDEVKKLFEFEIFDENGFADNLMSAGCKYSELKEKINAERKRINSINKEKENLSIEQVFEIIENSGIAKDIQDLFLTPDLSVIKNRILSDNNTLNLYHGSQSTDGEKFESIEVKIEGAHKVYKDICYVSKIEMCTSNAIRAISNFEYYLKSMNRCKRERKKEIFRNGDIQDAIRDLHKTFGYSENDIQSLVTKVFEEMKSEKNA